MNKEKAPEGVRQELKKFNAWANVDKSLIASPFPQSQVYSCHSCTYFKQIEKRTFCHFTGEKVKADYLACDFYNHTANELTGGYNEQ